MVVWAVPIGRENGLGSYKRRGQAYNVGSVSAVIVSAVTAANAVGLPESQFHSRSVIRIGRLILF